MGDQSSLEAPLIEQPRKAVCPVKNASQGPSAGLESPSLPLNMPSLELEDREDEHP